MAKRTSTKTIRQYDAIPSGIKGRYNYVKRDTPFPPMPRKEMVIDCRGVKVAVMVSQGQFINKEKVCKKYFKNQK